MSICFKANIRTDFFNADSLVRFHEDHEELILTHEKSNCVTVIPFHKIKFIHLSMDHSELNIRANGTIIEGIVLDKENIYKAIEMLRGIFRPLFVS